MPSYHYFLSFGSNLGDCQLNCTKGIDFLNKYGCFLYISRGVKTLPLTHPKISTLDQPPYWNLVAEYISYLSPKNLYKNIRRIENELGHKRVSKWQSRHLDIDILQWALYTSKSKQLSYKNDQGLRIPHPALKQRKFLQQLFPVTKNQSTFFDTPP